MKPIKERRPLTVEEAVRLLQENKGPIKVESDDGNERELVGVQFPNVLPFVTDSGFAFNAVDLITERMPNAVSDGLPELPEGCAYIQKGPLPEDKRPRGDEERAHLLSFDPDKGEKWKGGYAGFSYITSAGDYHYAVKCRSVYARRCWPELVEAMELTPQWKVGDTVEDADGNKGVVTKVTPQTVRVKSNDVADWVTLYRIGHHSLKPWKPVYGYTPEGERIDPPEGWEIVPESEVDGLPLSGTIEYQDGWTPPHGEGCLKYLMPYPKRRAVARRKAVPLKLEVGKHYLMSDGAIFVCEYEAKDFTDKRSFFINGNFYNQDGGRNSFYGPTVIREVKVTELDGSPIGGAE